MGPDAAGGLPLDRSAGNKFTFNVYIRKKPPVKPVGKIVLQARTVSTNKVGGIVGRGHRTPP
jgi:hypothetical protein